MFILLSHYWLFTNLAEEYAYQSSYSILCSCNITCSNYLLYSRYYSIALCC